MLNKKAFKAFMHDKGFRVNGDALVVLEKRIEAILYDAVLFAREDRRLTVSGLDIERAIKYQAKK